MAITQQMKEQITKLYVGYFDRAPDPEGLTYWLGRLEAGMSIDAIAQSFAVQSETTAKYPYLANPTLASSTTFITTIYQNLFNRAPDAAGLAYWQGQLDAGYPVGKFILAVTNGAQGADATIVANKVDVGLDWAVDAANTPGFMYNAAAASSAASATDSVDATAASVTAAKAATDTFFANGGGTASTTTELKTTVDSVVGTNGADFITGVVDGAATTTFGNLDSIDGGQGVDTVTLVNVAGTMTLPTAVTVKNVESLVLRSGANAVTADVQNWTGLEKVSVENLAASAVDLDVKSNVTSATVSGGTTVAIDDNGAAGADKLATVSIKGNTGAATITSDAVTSLSLADTNQNATVTAAAATRALALTLNNVTGGTIADAEATSLAVSTTGKASTGITVNAAKATSVTVAADEALTITDVNVAAAKSLVVTGDSLVTLNGATTVTALETLDASKSTGGLNVTVAIGNGMTFTGGDGKDGVVLAANTKTTAMGKGDDTVTLTGSALGTGGSVDGGEGTDTLVLTAANAITASADTKLAAAVKGFEVLQIDATAGAGEIKVNNLNNAGANTITKVVAAGAIGHATTISGLASGNTIEFKAANAAATTAAITNANIGTTDVLNIGITNAAGINVNTVVAADVETVNFLTDDTATTPTGIQHTAALTAASAKTITVTGDAGLALTFTGTALTSFDASGVTKGGVSLTTGALADVATLKGGAGDDTINAAAATKAVTIEGGAGNDTITGSSTVGSTLNGGAGNDTITGGAGADTINGGDGNDTITSGAGLDIVNVGAGNNTFVVTGNANGNTYASLTGMDKGDMIDFQAGGAAATFVSAKIALANTAAFADYLEAATAGGADRVSWFQYGGDTYLVHDVSAAATFTNGAAADQVVKLTGLVDLSTATIDGAATNVLTLG